MHSNVLMILYKQYILDSTTAAVTVNITSAAANTYNIIKICFWNGIIYYITENYFQNFGSRPLYFGYSLVLLLDHFPSCSWSDHFILVRIDFVLVADCMPFKIVFLPPYADRCLLIRLDTQQIRPTYV